MNSYGTTALALGLGFQRNPTLVLLILAVPLVWLAWRYRIFPSVAMVGWLLVPGLLTLVVIRFQSLWPGLLLVDLALLMFAVVDLWRMPQRHHLEIVREVPPTLSLRKSDTATLTISNLTARPSPLRIRDGYSADFRVEPPEFRVSVPPRSRLSVDYQLTPLRRGAFEWQAVHVCLVSRFRLWNRYVEYPSPTTIKVYPDLKQLGEYALLARTNRLSLMGVRRTRRIGQDNEFERLRDYTFDDNYKHIDWRSTARRNKLTVKDFQTNQSQRVLFLIDCGRMMTNESSGMSLLDHAFNAMLMMAYVALDRGDSVGLVTFSDRIHSSIPPRSGKGQMNHLLHGVFDRFPRLVESRYEEAFLHLATCSRKRSLVVLISNVIDDVNARQIQQYLSSFSKRHLPLIVLLRDRQLFDPLHELQPTGADLYRAAAAAEIVSWRQQVLLEMQQQGVLVLDTPPEKMTVSLINQYLEIKARHLL